jgi:hypothetical protein
VTFESDSNLLRIENSSFVACPSIWSIAVPGRVLAIADDALGETRLTVISVEKGSLFFKITNCLLMSFDGTSINGFMSFQGRPDLTIAKTVREIPRGCFRDCGTICQVTFEPGAQLSQIGVAAFYSSSLSSICIPASVRAFGEYSFCNCHSLSHGTFEPSSKLLSIEASAFCLYSALSSICIHSSVEQIGEDAFCGCTQLSEVAFESDCKLARIEASAFQSRSSIPSICIPWHVESIGPSAFSPCTCLSQIHIAFSHRFAFLPPSKAVLARVFQSLYHLSRLLNCRALTRCAFGMFAPLIDLHSFLPRNNWRFCFC